MKRFIVPLIAFVIITLSLAVAPVFSVDSSLAALTKPQQDRLAEMRRQAAQLNQLPSAEAPDVIGRAIQILMMFMGAIMFLLVIYAGLIYMTAQGNAEKISKATTIVMWAGLGVAVMMTSYIFVNFIFSRVE